MSQSTIQKEERIPSDDSSSGSEEGWDFLLGGLSTEAMACTDWAKDEIITSQNDSTRNGAVSWSGRLGEKEQVPSSKNEQASIGKDAINPNHGNFQNHLRYQKLSERAFSVSPVGQIQKPPVRILDRSSENQGNVLIAARDIPKGSVIFTEKALEAIQVPSQSSSNENHQYLYKVRGCQNCFRSLEPASCLSSSIPFSELWPVPEYDGKGEECVVARRSASSTMMLHPKSGRITCQDCGAIFCNKYCAKHHLQTVGDCCQCSRAMEGLVRVIVRSETQRLFSGDSENSDEEDCFSFVNVDPVLVLAARMFVSQVQRYRAESSDCDSLFSGLCGEAEDIRALGYNEPSDTETSSQPLQHEYEAVAAAIDLTELERNNDWRFSLRQFHKLVAIAQRNSISLTTGSPFRTYYQAMVRKTGGRGSSRQQRVVSDVARLLGSEDGKLTRDMDRMVEDKCVVKMGGIFTLTAFMNHSCGPNAEIRGQEYVDCNIDIVAKEDIRRGEEICISYLNLGANPSYSAGARNRRRKELSSRYLFHCQCSRCIQRVP